MSNPYEIDIEVETSYMADHSEPEKDRYVFAYTITLVNRGSISAKLLTRRWIITDADNRIEEVEGEGVVGEQPTLKPGEGFRYTSGTVVETLVATLHGTYKMLAKNGNTFNTDIPQFVLSAPRVLH